MVKHVTAIILASGFGKRFHSPNGEYKLAAKVTNQNHSNFVLMHVLDNLKPAVAHRICIINDAKKEHLSFLRDHDDIQVIENNNAHKGMSESIKLGVDLIPPAHGIMICLGDMPFIKTATYHKLIQAFLENGADQIVRPTYKGKDGHPVIFPYRYCPELLMLKGDQGAKSILRKDPIKRVACDDAGIIQDVDHYSDLTSL